MNNKLWKFINNELIEKIQFWWNRNQTIIISGADYTHYKSLFQFLANLKKTFGNKSGLKIIIWDLGLVGNQLKILQDNFYEICTFYKFNYKKYPDWFNIKINAGEYAWKPLLIFETIKLECTGKNYVLWLDSGDLISSNDLFKSLLIYLKRSLIYSPISSGSVIDWTHPKMLSYLNVASWDFNPCEFNNRNGAVLGFYIRNNETMEFIENFARLSLIKDCIAPQGSSRENHRQDQALFTLLYYKFHYQNHKLDLNMMTSNQYGISTHNDINEVLFSSDEQL